MLILLLSSRKTDINLNKKCFTKGRKVCYEYLNPCLAPARLYGQYGSVPPEVSENKNKKYRKNLGFFNLY
jgi:hypothetical protein